MTEVELPALVWITVAKDINANGQRVKIRHPLAPLGLGLITLGIYPLVWYYKINTELRGQGEKVSPGVALVAVTFGALIIVPPFVSIFNTSDRIRRVQQRSGVSNTISPVLSLIMLFIPLVNLFQTAYMQSELNQAWERLAA